MPYALALTVGWLMGFGPVQAWPAISLGLCVVTLALYRRDGTWWGLAINLLAVGMLFLDLIYWGLYVQGVDIWSEYSNTLNVGLALQLVLVGHRGVKSGWTRLLDWCGSRLRRPAVHGGCHAKEA